MAGTSNAMRVADIEAAISQIGERMNAQDEAIHALTDAVSKLTGYLGATAEEPKAEPKAKAKPKAEPKAKAKAEPKTKGQPVAKSKSAKKAVGVAEAEPKAEPKPRASKYPPNGDPKRPVAWQGTEPTEAADTRAEPLTKEEFLESYPDLANRLAGVNGERLLWLVDEELEVLDLADRVAGSRNLDASTEAFKKATSLSQQASTWLSWNTQHYKTFGSLPLKRAVLKDWE